MAHPARTRHNQEDSPKKAYQPRPWDKKWAIYPDYWKEEWGPIPLLGFVFSPHAFDAERKAYDKGLLPKNVTFGPKALLSDGTEDYDCRMYKKHGPKNGVQPMRRPLY
jgi:hypothetical protein